MRIVEVAPRDGLQYEESIVSVENRVEFINLLTQAGFQTIEVGSFVAPKLVPQMEYTQEVYQQIHKSSGCSYSVLVPNLTGLAAAIKSGCTDIAVFGSASEVFSQKNIHCSIEHSLKRFMDIRAHAPHNIKIRGYISCVFADPEGCVTPIKTVVDIAKKLLSEDIACYEISLGDTTGVGTPVQVITLIKSLLTAAIPVEKLAVHFHDTGGRALDNIRVALDLGVSVIDSAAGGLGGCPYAKGASGNVATEAVVNMLNKLNIRTGVDLEKLSTATNFIREILT